MNTLAELGSDDIQQRFDAFDARPQESLAEEFSGDYQSFLPEGQLHGASILGKLDEWIRTRFRRRIEREGEQGRKVLAALRNPKLRDMPDLLKEVVLCITAWFFPEQERAAATIALVVILTKVLATSGSEGEGPHP